ncbi:MAG: PAP2 family protein, partial [Aequorivita sp.]|nr:PAP2 family protein [Aequorivita sp.]
MKSKLIALLLFLSVNTVFSQEVTKTDSIVPIKKEVLKFDYKALIIPSALMAYGIIGIESDGLKGFNANIREEVTEDIDDRFTVDDFS